MLSPDNTIEYKEIKNIIFDLDGTLIDSAPSILKCLQMVVEKNNYSECREFDSFLIGPPLVDTFKRLTNEHDQKKIDVLVEDFKCEYDQGVCNLVEPYFGIHPLLEDLKTANKNIYIVTNKRYLPTKKIISHLGWTDLIDNIYTIDFPIKLFREKSQVINQLLLDLSLIREYSCYVGDRLEDWAAADANDISFIHALWGYGPDDGSALGLYCAKNSGQLRNLLIG